ncbi:MAG TPA: membrane protein insertase YidC [Terriglobales bacterium]|nr:membrane protein insertase YidC [Terriglobales bacterium]
MAEFQNPQQEPGMERRLLLVFALTFVVIVLFQPILKKYLPQSQAPAPSQQTQGKAQAAPQAASSNQVLAAQAEIPTLNVGATKQATTESETVVENDLYRITFTNRGAQVKSWILKKYDDDKGQPLDLVNNLAAEKYGYPLSLWTYDEAQRNKLNSALYVASSSGTLEAPAKITFEYADGDVAVRKSFDFNHTYVVHVETSVVSKGSQVAAYPAWPAGFGDQSTLSSYSASQIEHQYNNNTERLALKKVSGGTTLHMPFNWAGVTDQYFAAVFLPDDSQNSALVTLRNPLNVPKDAKNPNPQDTAPVEVLGAAVGNPTGPTVGRMYVGPKALATLESVPVPTIVGADQDLRSLINFGFWGIIARPLFLWLRWTYGFIHNWGWAICIQTLIINLALMPLRISSMKSALKMQKIQPHMNSIKEKYKKYGMRDPRRQEMNTEIGELMKREGVSPVGGCLPLVIQMPFLFAYYSMLGSALDLRHASWMWIHDLSSADPWHILPIGIFITMLFMQRMTPQAGMDPSQQKLMNVMMPVMMGILSYKFASGLCLYWAEGNLIAIVQQLVMNRTSLGREMREMAAKRARKKEK